MNAVDQPAGHIESEKQMQFCLKQLLDAVPRSRSAYRPLAVMDNLIRARSAHVAVTVLPLPVLEKAHDQLEELARGLPDRSLEKLRSRVAQALFERTRPFLRPDDACRATEILADSQMIDNEIGESRFSSQYEDQ